MCFYVFFFSFHNIGIYKMIFYYCVVWAFLSFWFSCYASVFVSPNDNTWRKKGNCGMSVLLLISNLGKSLEK